MKHKHLECWFSFNNGAEKVRLPVLPEKISVSSSHEFHDVIISRIGETTIIGEEQMEEVSFSSLWPETYDPGICDYSGFMSPENFINKLKQWRKKRMPIRFLITNSSINLAATIRKLDYEWDGFDIMYNLTLKRYSFINFESVNTDIKFDRSSLNVKVKIDTKRPDTRKEGVSSSKSKKKSSEDKEPLVEKYLSRGKK